MGIRESLDSIATTLLEDAIWHNGHVIWFGDEVAPTPYGVETVYRATGGSVYGGTAGIGAFLAGYAAAYDDPDAARTACAAFDYAVEWAERTTADGALLTAAGGIAASALEAAHRLQDDRLLDAALRAARAAVARLPKNADLVSGQAGAVIALCRLDRGLRGLDDDLADAARVMARTAATSLMTSARSGPAPGRWWPASDDEPDTGLCGLAHGASGVALALTEWGTHVGCTEALTTAEHAATYERSWYSPEHLGWPDLREFAPSQLRRGQQPSRPLWWCHGGVGIGATRLRQYALTGLDVYAAEAEAVVDLVVRHLNAAAVNDVSADMSICHGLSGMVDFLIDASTVFQEPILRDIAAQAAEVMAEARGRPAWPCGVPGGGENPSLFLGLAGVGAALLRLDDPRARSTVLAYADAAMPRRIIVQLSGSPSAEVVQRKVEDIHAVLPSVRVERVSPRGRAILRLPPDADIDSALAALNQLDDVDYAERDVTDTAQEPPC